MEAASNSLSPVIHTRGYQQELLEESKKRNIVIALDTGSGKTHIAILRMKHEIERNAKKISWFIAPTVTLIDQQREAIAAHIPVPVGSISGEKEPEQWRDASLWAKLLKDYRIIVSTPQVLLDALRHAYINLGRDISLIVFDEAHHAIAKHPYNMIMQTFYHTLPRREDAFTEELLRPAVLGLTASPIYGGHVEKSFRELEKNLDSIICTSRHNRNELSKHVHRPIFKHVLYTALSYDEEGIEPPSSNLVSLRMVMRGLDIENDPYVISLRSQLANLPIGEQRNRVDQRLSKTLLGENTFTHKGIRDFERAATDICKELGPWVADWYIAKVIGKTREMSNLRSGFMAVWQETEKTYLLQTLAQVDVRQPSDSPQDIKSGMSPKVRTLMDCLLQEEKESRTQEEPYSGIIFVTRRDVVLALGEVLSRIPEIKQHFQAGCLLGNSGSFKRHAFLDITRTMLKQTATEILNDFRIGDKNLIVSTAVAEEGIDIQACGNVIRFDPPPNMVAWAQSRGRARRRRSTFILLLDDNDFTAEKIAKWEAMERDMIQRYTERVEPEHSMDNYELDDHLEFRVPETGAVLNLDSAMSHLHHFCAVLPHRGHANQVPIFDLDPPDFVEGWHNLDPRPGGIPYRGPWGAVCTLPRQLPPDLRRFSTDRVYPTKQSATNHVAFFAYYALYRAGLLNHSLLPLTSVVAPEDEKEVKILLQEVEKRASTANVPIQMDPWLVCTNSPSWWLNEIAIGDLLPLYMFTPTPLPVFADDELPVLYAPGKGALRVRVTSSSTQVVKDDVITSARAYTRRMFSALHGQKMPLDKDDFLYLFLPTMESENEQKWQARRRWVEDHLQKSGGLHLESDNRANADALARQFGYALDWALVRSNDKFNKVLQFAGWHDGPLSEEEKEELLERYDGYTDVSISHPLLVVQALPRRANFLVPLATDTEGLDKTGPYLLLPQYATVDLISTSDTQYSLLIPSLLRFLSVAITVNSTRNTLFASTKLQSISFVLLQTALTAPVSQEPSNYQRLETLGDTVLKYLTSIQLFSQYPLWHEGYLARRKDHAINNNRLAKEAIRTSLYRWIVRDRFVPRKWRPRYVSDAVNKATENVMHEVDRPEEEEEQAGDIQLSNKIREDQSPHIEGQDQTPASGTQPPKTAPKKRTKQTQELSTKMLADVVESLIGAAYEHGGFDLALECTKLFGLGIETWDPMPMCIERALSRLENLNEVPPQFALVEKMIGYEFSRKILLAEALTHGSYTGDIQSISYERLEFIGDAALDMVVTDYLYHAAGKNYSPGYMHIHKEALVNSHFLAFVCMNASTVVDAAMPTWTQEGGLEYTDDSQEIHLFQCLLHSSTRLLEDQNVTFARYKKNGAEIQQALEQDRIYPWAALTSLQAPKFISDMVESLLGAVFLDSNGNLDAVRQVLRILGIQPILERIASGEVDDLHPVSRLSIWAAKHGRKWEIVNEKADGNAVCIVKIDDQEESRAVQKFRGRTSVNEVRFAAAEGAIRKFHIIEQEEVTDLDDPGWGDIPDYDW